MKKSLNNLALLAIAGVAAFSSCSKDMELYNPNATAEEYAKNWEDAFGTIDSQQDWNMATQVSATISINEDALSDYNLQLFTANPLYEDAYILADFEVTTDASGNASKTFNVDIPKGTTQLYAVRMDSHKRRLVKLADVTSSGINVSFGSVASAKAAPATRVGAVDDMSTTKKDCPYTVEQVAELKESAAELGEDNADGIYKVSSEMTYTKSINSYASITKLIITNGGILKIGDGKFNVQDYTTQTLDIIIENGGQLDISNASANNGESDAAVKVCGGASIIVMQGGKIIDNKESSYSNRILLDGGYLYNAGEISTGNITINGNQYVGTGHLYNADSGVLNADFISLQNTDTELTNWGKIYCKRVWNKADKDGTYQAALGTINNGCYMQIDGDFLAHVLNQAASTAIEAGVMQITGTWTVRENSILRADETRFAGSAQASSYAVIDYKGTSGGHALASFETISQIGDAQITNGIYLETNTSVVASADTGDKTKPRSYTGNNSHNFTEIGLSEVGEATLTIPAGDCTGSGNTPNNQGGGGNETPNYWIIACEDLGNTGDRDFNDIVVKVAYVAGKEQATVTPLAAGGVYKAVVKHDGGLEKEIHEWLGQTGSDGSYPITNTIKGGTTGSGDPVTIDVNKETFSMANHGITITVSDGDKGVTQTITSPKYGTAPAMLVLPNGWRYPAEYQQIEKAYTTFGNWVTDADVSTWTGSGVESLLY